MGCYACVIILRDCVVSPEYHHVTPLLTTGGADTEWQLELPQLADHPSSNLLF